MDANRQHPNRVVDFQNQKHHRDFQEYLSQFYVGNGRDGIDGVTGDPIAIAIKQYRWRNYGLGVEDGKLVKHPGVIWLRRSVDGMMKNPDDLNGPMIEEPWTKWDVRRYQNPNARVKVPILGPGVEDREGIIMDVYDELFDKYDGWLDLPAPKIKDLIAHAAMLPPEKRQQYLCLAVGREAELAALDQETLVDRMALGLAKRLNA